MVLAALPAQASDIGTVISQRCASCHQPGGDAPFSLTGQQDIEKRARQIAEAVESGDMPPWQPTGPAGVFHGDQRLSAEEKLAFTAWRAAGFPAAAPPPPRAAIAAASPTLMVRLPEVLRIPAAGAGGYRHFQIPVKLPGFRGVRAIAIRPTSRAVRHALARLSGSEQQPGLQALLPCPLPAGLEGLAPAGQRSKWAAQAPQGAKFPPAMLNILTEAQGGWAPGFQPAPLPAGAAWSIPARPVLHVSLWVEPTGKPESERTLIGLELSQETPAPEMLTIPLRSCRVIIPAGSRSSEARARFVTPVPLTLWGVSPRAGRLGMMVSLTAALPGKSAEDVLRIKEWDAASQRPYDFAEPVKFPAGARFDLCVRYDNSSDNSANPHTPPRHVRLGAGDADEMAAMLLRATLDNPADRPKLHSELEDASAAQFAGLLASLDEGPQTQSTGKP